MKRSFIMLGLVASGLAAHAQSATHKGKILGVSGEPAANVYVQLEGSDEETETDENGEYQIDVAPGHYILVVEESGKMPRRIPIEIKLIRVPLNPSALLQAIIPWTK